MKTLFLSITTLLVSAALMSQPTRVAIIDFENISGIAKYDGLGKAMSSMLISDIEANVSPKRLQLVERAQIQKVIKEQNFQASGSVDKTTAVKAGKILGVTYMLVGDVYILNDQLIINARLANTETGDIVFSKKQEGKTTGWLTLKTAIAQDIAASLSMPFTEPTIQDSELAIGTITTFGNAISARDQGNIDKAQSLVDAVTEINPEFTYVDDLRKEIEKLKLQVAQNTEEIKEMKEEVIENTTNYLDLGYKYFEENDYIKAEKYFTIGLSKNEKDNLLNKLKFHFALCQTYFNLQKFEESLLHAEHGLKVYPFFKDFIYHKYMSLFYLGKKTDFDNIVNIPLAEDANEYDDLILKTIKSYCDSTNMNYSNVEQNYITWKIDCFGCKWNDGIRGYKGEFYFSSFIEEITLNDIVVSCIMEAYPDNPEKSATLMKKLKLTDKKNKSALGWNLLLTNDLEAAKNIWDDIVLSTFGAYEKCSDIRNKYWHEGKVNFPTVELAQCLQSMELNSRNYKDSDFDKMSIINWGHAYLLLGDTEKAIEIYKIIPAKYSFGDDFNNKSCKEAILSDLEDFKKRKIISKEVVNVLIDKLYN